MDGIDLAVSGIKQDAMGTVKWRTFRPMALLSDLKARGWCLVSSQVQHVSKAGAHVSASTTTYIVLHPAEKMEIAAEFPHLRMIGNDDDDD